jgi:hypothetical protein
MSAPLLNKTKRYTRLTLGDNGDRGRRNVMAISFVSNDLRRPAVATVAAVHAAITGSASVVTNVTTGFLELDVPRNLSVTPAGTTADVAAGDVTVTGTNVEGKVISETFTFLANASTATVGNKAFKTVTSVSIPVQDGAAATFSIDTGSKLGIGMRNIASMPIKLLARSAAGVETLEDASASAFSSTLVESNTVTTTTTLDGAVGFRVYVLNYKWAINPTNAQPDYGV